MKDLFKSTSSAAAENSWILPVLLVAGGIVVGFIVEKILIERLKAFARKTSWAYDDIIVNALNFYTTFWFTLIGLYAASYNVNFTPVLLGYIHKIIIATAILSVTFFCAKIGVGIIRQYSREKTGDKASASIFVNITRAIILIVGILITMQSFGISITPIITALGVGGLAVALALQDTLSNFFAGIQLLITKQIRTGDFIRLEGGEEGIVCDINWRNTSIRTPQNNTVIIPNNKLSSSKVINYHLPEPEMNFPVLIGVSYNEDLDKVERVSLEVARKIMSEHPAAARNFEPLVRFHTFGDFSIQYNVILRAATVNDQHILKHEFIKQLYARFKKEGIEIPFPVRTIITKNS